MILMLVNYLKVSLKTSEGYLQCQKKRKKTPKQREKLV